MQVFFSRLKNPFRVLWGFMESQFKFLRHPIPPINCYELEEHEVRRLASESNPGQTFFNIMLAAFPVGITSLLALLAMKEFNLETWKLILFIVVMVVSLTTGIIFLCLWLGARKKHPPFLDEILARPVQGPVGDESKEFSPSESRELPESKDKTESAS